MPKYISPYVLPCADDNVQLRTTAVAGTLFNRKIVAHLDRTFGIKSAESAERLRLITGQKGQRFQEVLNAFFSSLTPQEAMMMARHHASKLTIEPPTTSITE